MNNNNNKININVSRDKNKIKIAIIITIIITNNNNSEIRAYLFDYWILRETVGPVFLITISELAADLVTRMAIVRQL